MTPDSARLSPIVAGAWRLAEWAWTAQQRLAWIEAHLDLGVTSFDPTDSAAGASVQGLFGQALALRPALRSQLQIVGQCTIGQINPARAGRAAQPGTTWAAHLRSVVEASLGALGTDHLDLLLVRQPATWLDFDELADGLEDLRRAGKVRQFGVAQFAPHQVAPLQRRIALAAHQVELSPLHLDPLNDGVLDQCQELGLRPMAWSPLAGGRLFTGQDAHVLSLRRMLEALAAERGVSLLTLVIAWVMRHPSAPLPMLGSRRIEVVRQAMAAMDLTLDESVWRRIWTAASGHAVD